MGCSASRPVVVVNKALDGCVAYFLPSRSRPLSSGGVTANSLVVIPKTRSLVAPVVHHPPVGKGDSHHLVSLISTTYGSVILLDHQPSSTSAFSNQSYSPDSVINTWELMEGLEDDDEDDDDSAFYSTGQNRRHSVDTVSREITEEWSSYTENSNSKPLWKHLSEESQSLASKFDSSSSSPYQRASSSRQFGVIRPPRISTRSVDSTSSYTNLHRLQTYEEDKIVVYYTSLRSIRKTYSDCCTVRAIFKGLRAPVDERDVSMDSSYRKELKHALGGKSVSLPQVFIKGKHIGGADEIKRLNEDGELTKIIDEFPVSMNSGFVCRSCGDARFVPCGGCNGSRKVFEKDGWKKRCSSCNENGLIRCSACCS